MLPVDVGAPPRFLPQARPSASRTTGSGEWAQGKRFAAHPAVSGRRFRGIPLVAVGLIGLVIGAALLFLLPGLLGGGGGGVAIASSSPKVRPTAVLHSGQTPAPTPTPVGTAHDYTVKVGDTLIGIKNKFSVSIAQLRCANNLRNPNYLPVGMVLHIPAPDYQCPRTGGKTPKPASSAAPAGSPAA